MEFARYTGSVGVEYYKTVTHLWMQNDDGQIEVCRKRQPSTPEDADAYSMHSLKWGEGVFDNPLRGYFCESSGILTCHGLAPSVLVTKLARKFQNAIYFKDGDPSMF